MANYVYFKLIRIETLKDVGNVINPCLQLIPRLIHGLPRTTFEDLLSQEKSWFWGNFYTN
jgi:hypothetical protein